MIMDIKLNTIPKLLCALAGALVGFNLPEIMEFLKNLFS